MSDLRTAAKQALEFIRWSQFVPCQSETFPEPPSTAPQVEAALHAALAEDAMQKFTDVNQEIENLLADTKVDPQAIAKQPSPPPEAQTEAEKIAYCAGWWAAMEAKRAERNELLEVVRDAITTLDRAGYPVAAEELRSAVAAIKSSPSPEVPSHSQTSGSHAPTP